MNDLGSLQIGVKGQIATITLRPLSAAYGQTPPSDPHVELGTALERMRTDDSVRVIVITGEIDGEFLVPLPADAFKDEASAGALLDPYAHFQIGRGIVRTFQAMIEIEKPIIAKVNGDAIGLGQSIAFGSDLIIAREDAHFSDGHLSMGEVGYNDSRPPLGLPVGIVPGDGAGALVPLFMTPTKAKEYMMLSAVYTGAELAEMNIVNKAVPLAELEAAVEDVALALLRRSAFALAWTKRLLNRHVADQLNRTLDVGVAYELLNLAHAGHTGFAADPKSLTR